MTTTRSILPATTDSNIDDWLDAHVVSVDSLSRGQLCVMLVGSNQLASSATTFVEHAASLGYHAISLQLPNTWNLGSLCSDHACFLNARTEILTGQSVSAEVDISVANSVINRLEKLLIYLDTTYSSENWDQFLTTGNTVEWSLVCAAGHSQGAGHALLLAKWYRLARVIMFSGPVDTVSSGGFANWIKDPNLTPRSAMYGFVHKDDSPFYPFAATTGWDEMNGLHRDGHIHDVGLENVRSWEDSNTHALVTDAAFTSGCAHFNVIQDACLPLDGSGNTVHLAAWTYLLTATDPPVDTMGDFWVNIEDVNGNILGDGPITTAQDWDTVARLDRAGTGQFIMPATDPRATLIAAKRKARAYTLINGAVTEIGALIIDDITFKPGNDGEVMIQVKGDDLLSQLRHRSVGFLALKDSDGDPISDALSQVMAFAPTGWSLDSINGYNSTTGLVYGQFAGENVLAALVRLSKLTGEHFRLGAGDQVVWLRNDQPDSGLRAVQDISNEADDADTCLIQDLQEVQDSYELVTRIYPYGAGTGQVRLTMNKSTRSPVAGYSLDVANNILVNATAEATYGQIERYLSWKDIAPISNSDKNEQAAANALYDQAYNHLRQVSEPQKFYRLSVTKLKQIIYPGQTIRVIYKRVVNGVTALDIDQDLLILEVTRSINKKGLRTTNLQVATIDRWPNRDADVVAERMEQGRLMEAHPQLTITHSPVGPYTRRMDSSNAATFTARVSSEVTALNYAILRFATAPLRSSTKGANSGGGSTETSTSGGASTPTSNSGGGSTETSDADGSHAHDIVLHSTLDTGSLYDVGYHKGSDELRIVTSDSNQTFQSMDSVSNHSHDVDIPAHTHSVNIPAHDHNVTIPAHSHNLDYGLFQDSQYPDTISIAINGVDVTSQLGGPWAVGGSATEQEVEITDILNNAPGGFRRNHTIVFSCTSGQGEIEVLVDRMMTIQAIAAF